MNQTPIDQLLDIVYAKCIPDEHGCMNWTGAVQSKCKNPTMRAVKGKSGISLRRMMLETAKQGKLNPLRVASYTCGNPKCVRLEHLVEISRKTLQQRNDSKFNALQRLAKSKRISDKVRNSRAKLTVEIAQEIFASDESQRILAEKYGVGQSTIGQIKRGATWRDYTNPFLRLAA